MKILGRSTTGSLRFKFPNGYGGMKPCLTWAKPKLSSWTSIKENNLIKNDDDGVTMRPLRGTDRGLTSAAWDAIDSHSYSDKTSLFDVVDDGLEDKEYGTTSRERSTAGLSPDHCRKKGKKITKPRRRRGWAGVVGRGEIEAEANVIPTF